MTSQLLSRRLLGVPLRWLAPLLAAVVFAGAGAGVSALTSAARADLPARSASTLLADIAQARVTGLSGTVVQHADLGIPALPGVGSGDGGGSATMGSLISGTHTLRVWYAGPDRARLSLVGDFGESDLVKNGPSVWMWSSSDKSATHWRLPAHETAKEADGQSGPVGPGGAAMTPQQAADAAVRAISPTTKVTTNGTAVVAGRPAYLLTLAPRSADTLVESVQVAIDGKTHVPTRVQVFAEGHAGPVFDVGFTSFNVGTPPDSVFRFNPPPGTKVTEKSLSDLAPSGPDGQSGGWFAYAPLSNPHGGPMVVGSGWSSVLVLPAAESTGSAHGANGANGPLTALTHQLPKVSGSWGSGRLLEGTVFSVLLTDDGQVLVGAVPPHVLYAALNGL